MTIMGLVGSGGYAREVMPLLIAQASSLGIKEIYFVVPEPGVESINGIKQISEVSFLKSNEKKMFNVAIADSKLREKIVRKYMENGCHPQEIRAANHIEYDDNSIGIGAILCANGMITSNTKIGNFFHMNIYSYVAHNCIIGDYVTFAPSVRCNGNVIVENHAYIGTGAILRDGTRERPLVIGEGAVVGMGAVVTKNVGPGEMVSGVPAKPMIRR